MNKLPVRRLSAGWTIDLPQHTGIDLESELAKTLADEMCREVLFQSTRQMLGEPELASWDKLGLPDCAAELKQQLESEYEYWYEAVIGCNKEVAKQARLVYNTTYETAQTYAAIAGEDTHV